MKPEQLHFCTTHEWVHMDEEGGEQFATVGISAFAVEALTDLVYIQLPEVGQSAKAGESFGEVESVKAVSDLYSPVDGQIVAVNSQLPDHLDALNQDPYGDGWMVKIRITDGSSLSNLLDYLAYQRQCEEDN